MAHPEYNGAWQRIRLEVLARDGHRCQMQGPACKQHATTVDHIIPRSQGGTRDMTNLRAACTTCNYSAGAKLRGRQRPQPPRITELTW